MNAARQVKTLSLLPPYYATLWKLSSSSKKAVRMWGFSRSPACLDRQDEQQPGKGFCRRAGRSGPISPRLTVGSSRCWSVVRTASAHRRAGVGPSSVQFGLPLVGAVISGPTVSISSSFGSLLMIVSMTNRRSFSRASVTLRIGRAS
jgi:hypothetical protein